MSSIIGWRQRALAWSAGLAGTASLFAAAYALTPVPLATHAALAAAAAPSPPARIAPPQAAPAQAMPADVEIDIQDFQFSPPALTVAAGTTVTWTSHDIEPHTVTSNERVFGSAGLDKGERFTFRFDAPGTYAYHCALHPFMTAHLVVQ